MATAKKITGVKTPAEQKKALATAKGPKPGSAMSNQSVKLDTSTPEKLAAAVKGAAPSKLAARPDVIKEVKNTTDGRHVAVKAGADNTLTFPKTVQAPELLKLAVVGASFKAVQAWLKTNKPEAKLATGLDGRSAPQSAMAAADSRKPGKGGTSASSAAKLAGNGNGAKGKAQAASGYNFTYATGKANDTRPDTWTHHMVEIMQRHTDSGAAKAAHAKTGRYAGKKLDFTWAKAKGFIK